MPAADLPPDEEERLKALHDLELLDTEPEEEFDELVRRAAEATGAPIAVITLVDEARQWFKAHAILTPDDLTVVPDTREDQRFNDNLLVTEDPNIRFYAGAPIFTPDGFPIGTLCVIDAAPRGLSDEQADALRDLAREVSKQIERRRLARATAKPRSEP